MTMPTLIDYPPRGSGRGAVLVPENVEILEAATEPVVSLADIRRHLKQDAWMGGNPAAPDAVGHPDDEAMMDMVAAATGEIEGPNGWLGRAIMPQTLAVRLASLEPVRLPMPPTLEVVSISVENDAGGWAFLADENWRLVEDAPHMRLEPAKGVSWPTGRAIVIYRAGYEPPTGDALQNPEMALIKSWVRMRVTDLYSNGGTLSKMGSAPYAANLLTNLRVRT